MTERAQPQNISEKTALKTTSKKSDIIYMLTTPRPILKEARKLRRSNDRMSRVSSIEQAERRLMEQQYAIQEPGMFAESLVTAVSESLKDTSLDDTEQGMINETKTGLEQLGTLTRQDIRVLRKTFKRIPDEHKGEGIKALEKAAITSTLHLLKNTAETMDTTIDREIADVFFSLHQVTKDNYAAVGGAFNPETNSLIYVGKSGSKWSNAHETGHGVFQNKLTDEQREEWEGTSKKAITVYAQHVTEGHGAVENFAEMYALYLNNKPLLKIWSLVNEDVKKQYEFFQTIMPKKTKIRPTKSGIFHPIANKIGKTAIGIVERKSSFRADEAFNVYGDNEYRGRLNPQQAKKLMTSLEKRLHGKVNEYVVDEMVAYSNTVEFNKRNWDLVHESNRLQEMLKHNGIWEEAVSVIEEGEKRNHTQNAEERLVAKQLTESETPIPDIAKPIFLGEEVIFITPEGTIKAPYTTDAKTKIDAAIQSGLLGENSLLTKAQMNAVHAFTEPQPQDTERQTSFKEKYDVQLINHKGRAFNAELLDQLDAVLDRFPEQDSQYIAGFKRIRDANERDRLTIKGKTRLSVIPFDDEMASKSEKDMTRSLCDMVATLVLQHNTELFNEFIDVSSWEKTKYTLLNRPLFALNQRRAPNRMLEYAITNADQETFLTEAANTSLRRDFTTCYRWFVLHNEEFREKASQNETLQKKYDLLEKHFAQSEQTNS